MRAADLLALASVPFEWSGASPSGTGLRGGSSDVGRALSGVRRPDASQARRLSRDGADGRHLAVSDMRREAPSGS